jgi:hypothetical protein
MGIAGKLEEQGPWRTRLDALMESLGRKHVDGKSE